MSSKAGMLLNVVSTLKDFGQLELARKQLDAIRSLLSSTSVDSPVPLKEQDPRARVIGVELEGARILGAEGKLPEAIERLNDVLAKYKTDLLLEQS
jgi:hypothetical protein